MECDVLFCENDAVCDIEVFGTEDIRTVCEIHKKDGVEV